MRRRAPMHLHRQTKIKRNDVHMHLETDFKSSMKIIYLDVGRLSENCTLNLPSAIHFINKIADEFIFHIGWLAWLTEWVTVIQL